MNVHRKSEAPARVTDRENREVAGQALVDKTIRERHEKRVAELRAKEKAYRDSLPSEPAEALAAISRGLPDMTDFHSREFAIRAALILARELATERLFVEGGDELNDAMFWLTSRAIDGLAEAEAKVAHARAVAQQFNPMREPYQA